MKIRKKSVRKKYKKNKKTFKKRRVINKKKKKRKLKTLKKKGGAAFINGRELQEEDKSLCNTEIDCNDYANKESKMRFGAQSIVYDCNEKHCKPEEGKKVICVAARNEKKKTEEKVEKSEYKNIHKKDGLFWAYYFIINGYKFKI